MVNIPNDHGRDKAFAKGVNAMDEAKHGINDFYSYTSIIRYFLYGLYIYLTYKTLQYMWSLLREIFILIS